MRVRDQQSGFHSQAIGAQKPVPDDLSRFLRIQTAILQSFPLSRIRSLEGIRTDLELLLGTDVAGAEAALAAAEHAGLIRVDPENLLVFLTDRRCT